MEIQNLNCWAASRELAKMTFDLMKTDTLKKESALRDQLIRAALSVMNNIAEGHGRYSNRENVRFLDIAIASCIEVESMTFFIEDIRALKQEDLESYRNQVLKTKKLVKGYVRYLKNRDS